MIRQYEENLKTKVIQSVEFIVKESRCYKPSPGI